MADADFSVVAAPSAGLSAIECLMVKELEENACKRINGVLDYSFYNALR